MLYVHTHPILSITKISYFLTITTYNKHSKKYFYNTPNLEVGGHYECCGKLKMILQQFENCPQKLSQKLGVRKTWDLHDTQDL